MNRRGFIRAGAAALSVVQARRLLRSASRSAAGSDGVPELESLYSAFRNPSPAYSASPYWFWNGRINATETRRQINEMVKQGVYSAVVMNWAGLEPTYLSEAYWQEVGSALEAARAAGLTLNFPDEYLWPSGQAWNWSSLNREPSRVLQLHPEFRMRRLTCKQLRPNAAAELGAEPEVLVAARRVHLAVDAPPGTEGKPLSLDIPENEIPERAIVFAPRTTPFTLACWTDSALANYSGSALYETSFDLAELPAGERLVLDLGRVGLAAEVWVNDQKAGERAWQPFLFDFTPHARRGANRLRIRVANSNAGWMAQGDPIYQQGSWGVNFASERDRLRTLHPNGLEGPVRILAVKP